MASRGDKVEKSVNSVVSEARVTLDPGLFSKDVIVLAFEIANDFLEATEVLKSEKRKKAETVSD